MKKYRANGKINLVLNVYNQDASNLHLVDFVMVPITLADEIIIKKAKTTKVICENVNLEDNLVLKAIQLFKKVTNTEVNVEVMINKYLPIGGGVGGGSSDAVCVFKALNDMYKTKLSNQEMETIVKSLGNDCPFFVNNHVCLASHYGEEISIIDKDIKMPIILINPGIELLTKDVFNNYINTNHHGDINKFLQSDNWLEFCHNDLLQAAIKTNKELQDVYEDLQTYNLPILLSGSGASFIMFINDDRIDINNLIAKLQVKYPYVYQTEVVNEFS